MISKTRPKKPRKQERGTLKHIERRGGGGCTEMGVPTACQDKFKKMMKSQDSFTYLDNLVCQAYFICIGWFRCHERLYLPLAPEDHRGFWSNRYWFFWWKKRCLQFCLVSHNSIISNRSFLRWTETEVQGERRHKTAKKSSCFPSDILVYHT